MFKIFCFGVYRKRRQLTWERSPDLWSALTMSIWSALTVLMHATTWLLHSMRLLRLRLAMTLLAMIGEGPRSA